MATGPEDDGFAAFVDAVLPTLLALGRRTALGSAEREDVAAEALARAFARWGRVRDLEYREAWVVRVAANLVVDRLRRPALLPLLPDDAAGVVAGPEDEAVTRTLLQAELHRLPRRQREALVLRYLADRSVDEVATAMNTSPNTAKKHLARGLERLRSAIGELT